MEPPPYLGALVMGIGLELAWLRAAAFAGQTQRFYGNAHPRQHWGMWHLYPGYRFNTHWGWLYLVNCLVGVFEFSAYALLITWVYSRTQDNLLVCILLHMAFTSGQIILLAGVRSSVSGILLHSIFAVLLWLVLAIVYVPWHLRQSTPNTEYLGTA